MNEPVQNLSRKKDENLDESEPKIILTKTEKKFLAGVIIFSCIAAVVLTVVLSICLPASQERKNDNAYYKNYSDFTADYGSTCLESTTFAMTNDPYYKWTVSSSSSTALQIEGSIPIAKATLGYQMASVWRDVTKIPNKEKNGTNLFINSPNPHILRGVIQKHSKIWIWKMTTNWGMSVQMCDSNNPFKSDVCFRTLPLVLIPDGNTSVLATLMIRLPFANLSSPKTPTFLPDTKGFYLSNLATSARALSTLQFIKQEAVHYAEDTWSYVFKGDVCNKANPICLDLDIVSYLASPLLQCRNYGDGVCSIGKYELDEDYKDFDKECGACESFWYAEFLYRNTSTNSKSSIFTYHPGKVTLNVTIVDRSLLTSTQILKNLSSCIKGWLLQHTTNSEEQARDLLRACQAQGVELKKKFRRVFQLFILGQNPGGQDAMAPASLLNSRVFKQLNDDVFCRINLNETQDRFINNICSMTMEYIWVKARADRLNKTLYSLAKVPTVKAAGEKIWERDRSKRTAVSVGIITALLTLAVTIYGMLSTKLQDMENFVFGLSERMKKKLDENTYGKAVLRTVLRVGFVAGAAAWSMWNLFMSLDDLQFETADATTTLKYFEGIMFLVTTTYSIQVTPKLSIFYAMCSTVVFTVVIFSASVYFFMLHTEREREQKKKTKESGTDRKVIPQLTLNKIGNRSIKIS